MKRLMITAAVTALVGGAFATNIFDYKASVKYVDLKTVTVKNTEGTKVKGLFKVVKSATLTGYLVTPLNCPCDLADGEDCRFGNLPGFLVLQNKAAKKYNATTSYVKLMPANLLSEWWTTKALGAKKLTLQAQGYLFAGVGKRDVPDPVKSPYYGLGDFDQIPGNQGTGNTGGAKYLFGLYNTEDNGLFIEPFLDQAGFGKATYDPDEAGEAAGCFWEEGIEGSICLTSLSGHLIGGSFMCYPNAVYVTKTGPRAIWTGFASEGYLCQGWDTHTENMTSGGAFQTLPQNFSEATAYLYNVVAGTWSIKANPKLEAKARAAGYTTERGYVTYVGLVLDKKFSLSTFDYEKRGSTDGRFVNKWFESAPVE